MSEEYGYRALRACMDGVAALISGHVIEPLLHPKPAAVTRLKSHEDKDVLDFAVHAYVLQRGMAAACTATEDRLARGFEAYRVILESLGIRRNIAVGTAVLLLPLAAAIGEAGRLLPPRDLAKLASRIALKSGSSATKAYYGVLALVKPSHLRRYRGPVPSVGEAHDYPPFIEVLKAASWDLVHSELLNGYRITLEVAERLGSRPLGPRELEERALREILRLLAIRGDTLILAKWGIRAYLQAKVEARMALALSEKVGVNEALVWLDSLWRPRGWNPGAVLDIVAAAVGFYFYNLTSTAGLYSNGFSSQPVK